MLCTHKSRVIKRLAVSCDAVLMWPWFGHHHHHQMTVISLVGDRDRFQPPRGPPPADDRPPEKREERRGPWRLVNYHAPRPLAAACAAAFFFPLATAGAFKHGGLLSFSCRAAEMENLIDFRGLG